MQFRFPICASDGGAFTCGVDAEAFMLACSVAAIGVAAIAPSENRKASTCFSVVDRIDVEHELARRDETGRVSVPRRGAICRYTPRTGGAPGAAKREHPLRCCCSLRGLAVASTFALEPARP
jgi:hypothetical protein